MLNYVKTIQYTVFCTSQYLIIVNYASHGSKWRTQFYGLYTYILGAYGLITVITIEITK